MTPRASRVAIALAVGITAALYIVLHWRGTNVTHDGWGYWQGAISLAEGRGYRYLSGTPIAAWPPLYPLLLAPWAWLLGPTTIALVLGNGTLAMLQAGIWAWAIPTLWEELTARPCPPIARVLLGVYVGCFVGLREAQISAALVVYAVLPLFLLAIARGVTWAAALTGALLLLAHSHALAFVAAGAVLAGWRRGLIISGVPMIVWAGVRAALGQGGSHRVVLGGNYGVVGTAADLVRGMGALLVPDRAGLTWLAAAGLVVLVFWLRHDRAVRLGAAFAGLAAAASYGLFVLTWIKDPLMNRFLFFIPIAVVSLAWCATWSRHRLAGAALAVALLVPQAYWTQVWIRHELLSSLEALGYPLFYAPIQARLVSGLDTPRVLEDGTILLPPHPWEEPVDGRDAETERLRLVEAEAR